MSDAQARHLDMLNEDVVRIIQGKSEITLPLQILETISDECVLVQKTSAHKDMLGEAIAPVEIQRTAHD